MEENGALRKSGRSVGFHRTADELTCNEFSCKVQYATVRWLVSIVKKRPSAAAEVPTDGLRRARWRF